MKSVIILGGISGSGKSTYIENWKLANPDVQTAVFSADHFFIQKDGTYVFDPKLLGHAHIQCQRRFNVWCLNPNNHGMAFVDNTNLTTKERKFYVDLVRDLGIQAQIHFLPANVEVSKARNQHNVPPEKIEQMYQKADLEFGYVYDIYPGTLSLIRRILPEEVGM